MADCILPIDLADPSSGLSDDELDATLLDFLGLEDTPENRAKFLEPSDPETVPSAK